MVNGMDNEGQVRVLGVIDKLRELGINENVSLPQVWLSSDEVLIRADTRELVAVGDQSSGKSSLLEGLTGLLFAIASDLCTRFATQIVLRQTASKDTGAQITTIPGLTAQANDKLKARLLTSQHNLREDEFGIDEFRDIFGKGSCHKIKLPTSSKLDRLHDTWGFLGQAA